MTMLTLALVMAAPPPRDDHNGTTLPPGAIARLGDASWRHGSGKGVVAVSPCSTRLATIRADGREVAVRELPGGRMLWAAPLRPLWLSPIGSPNLHTPCFADDGSLFLLGGSRWVVFPPGGGEPEYVSTRMPVRDCELTPDGRFVVGEIISGRIIHTNRTAFVVFDARTGRELSRTAFFDHEVTRGETLRHSAARTSRGVTIPDSGVSARNLFRPHSQHTLRGGPRVPLDSRRFVTDGGTRVRDSRNGRILLTIPYHEDRFYLRWWPDAEAMVSLFADGRTAVHPLGDVPRKPTRPFVVAAMDERGGIFGTDMTTGKTFGTRAAPVEVLDLAAFGAGVRIFRADGTADHWDARAGTRKKIHVPQGATALSASGRLATTRGREKWLLHGPRPGEVRELPEDADHSLAFSPDERFVVTKFDGNPSVIDTRTLRTRFTVAQPARFASFSADGRLVEFADDNVRVVAEVASGEILYRRPDDDRTPAEETGLPPSLAPRFAWTKAGVAHSRDGLYAAWAGDTAVNVRKRDGTLFVLRHSEGDAYRLAFSADGRTLYAACGNGCVVAWGLPEIEKGRR